ncbi:TonB family protein [Aminobacter carboxidus]|uniref:Energy transducer TonB n=1 Tax=Aminobacter carboxidus TaxID=376165 RepID=A0ABR9GRM3_9HYPH|nr:energy transducer TonB [Aminobacter carboxidus]
MDRHLASVVSPTLGPTQNVATNTLRPSGCAVRTANVSITTDNNGKMSSATISKTSGDPAFDKKALSLAKSKFQKLPNPRKNDKYLQPVDLMN